MKAAIVICTYERPIDLKELLRLLGNHADGRHVLVVDSSRDDHTKTLCEDAPDVTYIRSDRASLAHQRNLSLTWLVEGGYDLVHFLDDDSRPYPQYFTAMENGFRERTITGAGGIVVNQRPVSWKRSKALFFLDSRRTGRVLRSGRVTIGHYPGSNGAVEWLPGCAMSYLVAGIGDMRFDERLEGYSWGEDFDFSFRLSRRERLEIIGEAQMRHEESKKNRASVFRLARGRLPILHRWVGEHRTDKMSYIHFWWATLGEIALRLVGGLTSRGAESRGENLAVALGTASGIWDIFNGRPRRA